MYSFAVVLAYGRWNSFINSASPYLVQHSDPLQPLALPLPLSSPPHQAPATLSFVLLSPFTVPPTTAVLINGKAIRMWNIFLCSAIYLSWEERHKVSQLPTDLISESGIREATHLSNSSPPPYFIATGPSETHITHCWYRFISLILAAIQSQLYCVRTEGSVPPCEC